jgi:hypothetical protein
MADIKSKLILDNTQFNKATKTSTKLLGGIGKGLSAAAGTAKVAAVAFVALAGTITAAVAVSTRYIDRLGKVAKTTGFAAETLQKFQFAAELSGVGADQAAVALRRFSRRLGEAQKGTGELFPALKKLGIETRNSSGTFKSAEEILFEFADGIQNARNESESLALAFKAFDSEGAELVETMRGGADGLRKFFKEAESLGFILSTSAIQGVERFADEFFKLQAVVKGVVNQFTAALAPALESIVELLRNKITAGIEKAGGSMEDFGKDLKDMFITGIVKASEAIEAFINFLIEAANAMVKLARAGGKMLGVDVFPLTDAEIERMDKFNEKAKELMNGVPLTAPLSSNPAAQIAYLENAIPLLEAYGQETDSVLASIQAYRDLPTAQQMFGGLFSGDAGKDLLKSFKEVTKFVSDGGSAGDAFELVDFEKFRTQMSGFLEENKVVAEEIVDIYKNVPETIVTAQQTLLQKVFGLGQVRTFWEEWDKEGAKALEKFSALASLVLGGELVDKIKAGFENSDIGDFTKTLADGLVKGVEMFEDSLADAIVSGKADFSDLASHLKQVLAKAMVQKFVTGPIMGLFGLASGGPANAGQPYIVGEEGPELFIPKNSGTVIPNDETMAMAGGAGIGGGTQVTYNINAVDAKSFKQLVSQDPEFIFNVSQAGARRVPG